MASVCMLHRRFFNTAKNAGRFIESSTKKSSTQSFRSDKDPTEAESVPVSKYVGKRQKRKTMVYVCGLSITGALGLPHHRTVKTGVNSVKSGSIGYPYRLPLGDLNITTIDCGYGYTVFGSTTSDVIKVWGTGINTESQLAYHASSIKLQKRFNAGLGYYNYVMEPSPISIPFESFSKTKVLQVSCGRAHTLVLTDNEGIYSFGNNSYGQCGRPIIEGELYAGSRKIHRIHQKTFPDPVTKICCGMDHSLFLTSSGKVFSCGWGADGQTGLGSFEKTSKPTMLKGDLENVRIKEISTFGDLSLAVCDEGRVFGWGNSEYFQLSSVTEKTQINLPTKLRFSKVGKVVSVAAGGSICALLNDEGLVWVWGYGILGKGPELKDSIYPQKIPKTLFGASTFNPDVKVTKISCGLNHFGAVTNNGGLYTWGKNSHGCLGISERRDQYFPWKVLLPGDIDNVYCGVDHTVITSKSIL